MYSSMQVTHVNCLYLIFSCVNCLCLIFSCVLLISDGMVSRPISLSHDDEYPPFLAVASNSR